MHVQFDNEKAKQIGVAKKTYGEILADCVKHGVVSAAGDANMTVANGTLRMSLENVLGRFLNVKFTIHCFDDDDCMVGVVFQYEKSTVHRMRMGRCQYENHDFLLWSGDKDSHRPLKIHFSDGGRDRSEAARMFRDHQNWQRTNMMKPR